MFTSHSYLMENGYCDVMAYPVHKKCISGPFFSNPTKKFEGSKTGAYNANNAMWIDHNRFFLNYLGTIGGNDEKKCSSDYMYNSRLLDCFMKSKKAITNCSKIVSYVPNWKGKK